LAVRVLQFGPCKPKHGPYFDGPRNLLVPPRNPSRHKPVPTATTGVRRTRPLSRPNSDEQIRLGRAAPPGWQPTSGRRRTGKPPVSTRSPVAPIDSELSCGFCAASSYWIRRRWTWCRRPTESGASRRRSSASSRSTCPSVSYCSSSPPHPHPVPSCACLM
jgi:hypothetical protein